MTQFSTRYGHGPVRDQMQVESMDRALTTRLWNIFLNRFMSEVTNVQRVSIRTKNDIHKIIWDEYIGRPSDEIPFLMGSIDTHGYMVTLKRRFFNDPWYKKYDFMELIARIADVLNIDFPRYCNQALTKEAAGYRMVGTEITPITEKGELEAIERALGQMAPLDSVRTHLQSAIKTFSARQNPDYRLSVGQSITAVEAYCKILTNDEKATLGKALNYLEKERGLHPALKRAFSALYGHTSDSGGGRHALKEGELPFDLNYAKFMVVTCSAFINYLHSEYG